MIECISTRWAPGIGDPTIFGWLTVLLYAAAAVLSFLRARDGFAGLDRSIAGQRHFWLVLSILLASLGVNKQLDLQSLITSAARCLAYTQGWYADRRGAQIGFIAGLAAFAAAGGAWSIWAMRHELRRLWLALSGFFILVLFVLLRASRFHHMDALIDARVLNLRMNWVFEIGALVLIILGARRRKPMRNSPDSTPPGFQGTL